MNNGYCNICHTLLQEGQYKIIRGKKICLQCIAQQKEEEKAKKEIARLNDELLSQLINMLLVDCSEQVAPDRWYDLINGMIKKGQTVEGIINTLKYCRTRGKELNADNWSGIVYSYYKEAQEYFRERSRINIYNNNFDLNNCGNRTIKIYNTDFIDFPNYDIDDL